MDLNSENIAELENFAIFKNLFNSAMPFFIGERALTDDEGTVSASHDINHIIAAILKHYKASEI